MPINFKEEWQRVNQIIFDDDVTMAPPQPINLFTNNFIQRVFSKLFALGPNNKYTQLQCTAGGALFVSDTGGGYSSVAVISEVSTNAEVTYSFGRVINSPDFQVSVYAIQIWVSADGVTFTGPVTVEAGQSWSPPISVQSIKIEDLVAGNHGTLYAVGYY
jgi:hypothetical protein